MSNDRPVVLDDDNPEWTEADFARAKPLSEFPELEAALKQKGGRPKGSTTSDRQQVALRIPKPVIEHFKAAGPGWQTRMLAALQLEQEREQFFAGIDQNAVAELYWLRSAENDASEVVGRPTSLRDAVARWADMSAGDREVLAIRRTDRKNVELGSLYPDTIAELARRSGIAIGSPA